MSNQSQHSTSRGEKISALRKVAEFKPKFSILIVLLGVIAAALEAIGLGFILPVLEIVQSTGGPNEEATGVMRIFISAYNIVGVELTLANVIIGVGIVMTIRYTSSFLGDWLKAALQTYYVRYLQTEAFNYALVADVSYFDKEGSDDILNAIITQTNFAGRVIERGIRLLQMSLLSFVYILIAFIISPELTILTIGLLGGLTYLLRSVIEPGYDIGDRVADANEQRQRAAQAGTQGIRDIRIFGIADELREEFVEAVDKYTRSQIQLRRNEAALKNFYNLTVAVSVFMLIFLALRFANLSFSALGVFLFAMFQLGPKASTVNQLLYKMENDLPHLVRTQKFVNELSKYEEDKSGPISTIEGVENVSYKDVSFSYTEGEQVLNGITFSATRGEFIAFVGKSGAGKSTVASLLTRMYRPDEGKIKANGEPIEQIELDEWRDHLAVVRQDPYIFDDTLKYNLTIANRDVSMEEIRRVCKIAKVDEFIDSLPNGFQSVLGDDGVKLSGGQKQRIALARALLADADILILDEATSDLDTNLEKDVQRAIESMDQAYLIITIAHRLSTVKNADRIYTLEDGEISEVGEHTDLLEKGGKYAKLNDAQI